MDCTSELWRKFKDPKFSCSRTKCEAIAKNVIAPWIMQKVKNELSSTDSFCILVDSSNHGNQKLYPVCIRYCLFDVETGFVVNTKRLELVELQGETSQMLCSAVEPVLKNTESGSKLQPSLQTTPTQSSAD